MKVVISSGHGKYVRGAEGFIDEVDQARRVVDQTALTMAELGIDVTSYHDDVSKTQDENLNRIVDFHNSQTRDLDISVHFNETGEGDTSKPVGCEVLYVSQKGLEIADEMVDRICIASGLKNRGPKLRENLFFLNQTEKPAVLVEVCFVDSSADVNLYNSGFFEICEAIAATFTEVPIPEPGPIPPGTHQTIKKGSKGPDVVELQESLGVLIPDGDFGSVTDTWVRAFQAASGLSADGIVGPNTWAEVDDLVTRVEEGPLPLPKELAAQIYTLAQESEIADYSWPGRGLPPPGYIAGMALSFAYASRMGGEAIDVMDQAQGNPETDALAWYNAEFASLGMTNHVAGIDTLRHLFVMMIGLGPRESSGKYCEGRDMSASNVASDTCEAGLFQTSWNIRSSSLAIEPLLEEFWENPNGFLSEFKEAISPTSNNLNSYGSGDGVRYQWLSRFCPLFHVMVTAVGMRKARKHWGPINERAVTLRREADDMLKGVQDLVEVWDRIV